MKLSYLTEFAACARYMNMKDAANSLFMAQSSLSKHIKALEEEVGYPLIVYSHNKIHLTPQGAHFMNGIDEIIDMHNSMEKGGGGGSLSRKEERRSGDSILVVQQHSCIDLAAGEYYRFFNHFIRSHPEYTLRFAKSSRRTFHEKLSDGSIDAFLDYRYGSIRDTMEDYRSKGLTPVHLTREPINVWCHRLSPLNKKDLTPLDLRDVDIMLPTDVCAPFGKASEEFGQKFGFKLTFRLSASTNQPEYLCGHDMNSVYLYPRSFLKTPLITCYDDMVSVPFSDDGIAFDGYAVMMASDNEGNHALIEYADELGEKHA